MLKEKTRTETLTAPPRRWRNKMRAKERIIFHDHTYDAGDFFQAGPDYPSRDVAEAAATDFLSSHLDKPRDDEILANVAEYLGAFPAED
jgi:hypothetical protein